MFNNEDNKILFTLLGMGFGFIAGIMICKRKSKFLPENIDLGKAARIAMLRSRGLGRNHKMVFVVRSDLAMGKGKIAAQCSHAALMCYQKASATDRENLEMWEATGVAKVALKTDGDEKTLKTLRNKAKEIGLVTALVCDAGHTQVDPGTYTVLGIGPGPCSKIDQVTGSLKLL